MMVLWVPVAPWLAALMVLLSRGIQGGAPPGKTERSGDSGGPGLQDHSVIGPHFENYGGWGVFPTARVLPSQLEKQAHLPTTVQPVFPL